MFFSIQFQKLSENFANIQSFCSIIFPHSEDGQSCMIPMKALRIHKADNRAVSNGSCIMHERMNGARYIALGAILHSNDARWSILL